MMKDMRFGSLLLPRVAIGARKFYCILKLDINSIPRKSVRNLYLRFKVFNTFQRVKSRIVSIFLSILFGLSAGIIFLGGFSNLNPNNVDWISSDNRTAYLAQVAFINDDWRIPIGSNPNYGMDLATTLTNTGPAPLLAILQKLFELDAQKQYFGLWILLNFILQALVANAIAKSLRFSRLGNSLLVVSSLTPFFLFRAEIHYWLISHFLLLMSINYAIRKISEVNFAICGRMTFLCLLSYLINPYICAMVIIVNVFLGAVTYFEEKNAKGALKQLFVPALATLLAYFLCDGINRNIPASESLRLILGGAYGQFNFNLISFFNPRTGLMDKSLPRDSDSNMITDWSVIDVNLGTTTGSYEGYLYLGAGVLFSLFIAVLCTFKNRSKAIEAIKEIPWFKTLILILGTITLFAISHRVTIGSWEFYLVPKKIDYYLSWGLSLFRSSGRFMWVIGYLTIIFAIGVIDRYGRKKTPLLLLAIVFQLIDVGTPMYEKFTMSQKFEHSKKSIFDFSELRGLGLQGNQIERILLYPSGNGTYGFERVALWAMELDIPSNAFESAKINHLRIIEQNRHLFETICRKEFKKGTVYLVPFSYLHEFNSCNLNSVRSLAADNFLVLRRIE